MLFNMQKASGTGLDLSSSSSKARSILTDKNYRTTKVVAWLLNRPLEEEKFERQKFFNKLNQ